MGVLTELNDTGDINDFWDATKATIDHVGERFNALMLKGHLMFYVGEHESIEACERCKGTGVVEKIDPVTKAVTKEVIKPLPAPNAPGGVITKLKQNACEIYAQPRTAGG